MGINIPSLMPSMEIIYKKQGHYKPYWHEEYDFCRFCKGSTIESTEIICMRYPLDILMFDDVRWFFCNEACFNCYILLYPHVNYVESDWND